MASGSLNEDRGADFTEAIVTLRGTMQSLQNNILGGPSEFVLLPIDAVRFFPFLVSVPRLNTAGPERQ